MSSRRLQKAAAAVQQVVSMAILAELKDPRVRGVTVTHVEVAADMRTAKVHVSVMGDATQERLSLHGLRSAAGFLQSKINERIDTRYTPKLEFVLDQGVKNSIAIQKILNRVLPRSDGPDADADAETDHEKDLAESNTDEDLVAADSPGDDSAEAHDSSEDSGKNRTISGSAVTAPTTETASPGELSPEPLPPST